MTCFGSFCHALIWVYTHAELKCCPPKGTSFPWSGHAKTGTSHRGQSGHETVCGKYMLQRVWKMLACLYVGGRARWSPFAISLVEKSVRRCSMLFKRRLGAVELIRPTDARQCNFDFPLGGCNQDWVRSECFPV